MRTFVRLLMMLAAFLAPALAGAEVSREEIRELRTEIAALSARLAELEARAGLESAGGAEPAPAPQPPAPVPPGSGAPPSTSGEPPHLVAAAADWSDRVQLSGDFRYRWESIDREAGDSRERQRIRARPAIRARVTETVRAGFGLATGGDSPVSANQTLGGGGSSKPIFLDLAYFEWRGLDHARILGGKFRRTLRRPGDSSLIWDDDWRPEGFAAVWDDGTLYGTVLTTWLIDDGDLGTELNVLLQGGGRLALGRDTALDINAGYYQLDLAGREPLLEQAGFFGNSSTADGRYLYDYRVVELGGELEFAVGGRAASVFADYAQNLDADDYDTGWALGGTLGAADDVGDWSLRYFYQELEADAVLGLLTDSNFGGGGTDARGHVLSADYVIATNWVFRLTYFDNVINGDAVDRGDPGAEELDYDRLILDFRFNY